MKKFISLCIAVLMVAVMLPSVTFAAASLDYVVNYDESTITATYTTPTAYRQMVSFVLYLQSVENPTLADYVRIAEVRANSDGVAEVVFKLTDDDPAGLFVIKAQGGGYSYASSSAECRNVEFKNQRYINETLIPTFNAMTAAQVDSNFKLEKNLLGLTIDADYEASIARFAPLYVSVRNEDYPDEDKNYFKSMADVKKALELVDFIIEAADAEDKDALQAHIESSKELSGIDPEDADYVEFEEEFYQGFFDLVKENYPTSRSSLVEKYEQAIGLVMINCHNAEDMDDIIDKYGESIGIDMKAYDKLVKNHGAVAVNKAFVEKGFEDVSEIVEAFEKRKDTLEEDDDDEPSGGLGGRPVKDNFTSNEPIVSVTPTPEVSEIEFTDMKKNHWAFVAVTKLKNRNIVAGFPDGSFRPSENVTREQYLKMIVELLGIKAANKEGAFTDVASSHWASEVLCAAKEANIVNGYSDGSFGLGKAITRQDAAVMLYRALKANNVSFEGEAGEGFNDSEEISEYAKESVNALKASKLISGMDDGTFAPLNNLSRAQAAQMLANVIDNNIK